MKLRNKRRLFNLFKEFNVDIVLHGHVHESREYFRKGVRFLNAGATVKNDRSSVKINFLQVSKDRISVNIETVDIPVKIKEKSIYSFKNEHIKLLQLNKVA